MSSITTKKMNYRVVIEVPSYSYGSPRSEIVMRRDAEKINEEVRRHVDSDETPCIEFDVVCAHCEADPEIDKDGPNCCEKALKEWEANSKVPA